MSLGIEAARGDFFTWITLLLSSFSGEKKKKIDIWDGFGWFRRTSFVLYVWASVVMCVDLSDAALYVWVSSVKKELLLSVDVILCEHRWQLPWNAETQSLTGTGVESEAEAPPHAVALYGWATTPTVPPAPNSVSVCVFGPSNNAPWCLRVPGPHNLETCKS